MFWYNAEYFVAVSLYLVCAKPRVLRTTCVL